MASFRFKRNANSTPMLTIPKQTSAQILPGDMVTKDANGLALLATAGSTVIAFCPYGGTTGQTTVMVVADQDAEFYGTAATALVAGHRWASCDLAGSAGALTIAAGTSAVGVLRISGETSNVLGNTADTIVKIAKGFHLYA